MDVKTIFLIGKLGKKYIYGATWGCVVLGQ